MNPKFAPLLVMSFLLTGCLSSTPFQSARVVENPADAATLSVIRSVPETSFSDANWTMAEVTGRFPLKKGKTDASISGAGVMYDGGGFGAMFGASMKLELLPDILSVEIPVRLMLSGVNSLETTHIYPRAILSLPINDTVEINMSATRFYYTTGGVDAPVGYGMGLALGKHDGLIIRPEFGVLVSHNGYRTYQFGIGITPPPGKPKAYEESDVMDF